MIAHPSPLRIRWGRILFRMSITTALLLGFVIFQSRDPVDTDGRASPPPASPPSPRVSGSARPPSLPDDAVQALFESKGLRDWLAVHRPPPAQSPTPDVPPASESPEPPAPTPTPAPPRRWTLRYAGAFRTLQGRLRGVLELQNDPPQRVLQTGDAFDGFHVRELTPGLLVLERDGNLYELIPDQPVQVQEP